MNYQARKYVISFLILVLPLLSDIDLTNSAEKIQFGTAYKVAPAYYLPVLAAEEKGSWQKNGLDAEWVPFRSNVDLHKALVASSILVGLDTATGLLPGIAGGVPAIIVADLQRFEGVGLYVLPDSPIKKPQDLKGGKIGVSRFGSTDHADAMSVAKLLKMDKEVKYIGTGGFSEKIAALRVGNVDAITSFAFPVMEMRIKGQIREILNLDEFRPGEWMAHLAFAHKKLTKDNPDLVSRIIRAVLAGAFYVRQDPRWSIEKMKAMQGYSDKAAEQTYRSLQFTQNGQISSTALRNVRDFLVDYGIVPREKMPPVEELYTDRFTS